MSMDVNDKPRENCGIIGIYSPSGQAVASAVAGIIGLQHRGQEGAGIAVSDGSSIRFHKGSGLIQSVFTQEALSHLGEGKVATAHTRYSTSGSLLATQPFVDDGLALSHNGNLTNVAQLVDAGGIRGEIISDSWVAHRFICSRTGNTWEEKLRQALPLFRGAYSFVIQSLDKLFAIRDPWGFRPLVIGSLPDGGWVIASETCALQLVEATFIREVLPGEGLVFDKNGLGTFFFDHRGPLSRCVFEYVYIARPDSRIFGQEVHTIRRRCGNILSRLKPVAADVVISIPHSGDSAARGFSEGSGIPMVEGVFANRYVGRAFIEPVARRKKTTRLKYGVIRSDIVGKRVCAVDDSIVRGDASSNFVQLLRDNGAKEVHLRIASPPLKFPCFYGVDFATKGELIASRETSVEGIRQVTGADSLGYLSMEGLVEAVSGVAMRFATTPANIFTSAGFCGACFTGKYPVPVNNVVKKQDHSAVARRYLGASLPAQL